MMLVITRTARTCDRSEVPQIIKASMISHWETVAALTEGRGRIRRTVFLIFSSRYSRIPDTLHVLHRFASHLHHRATGPGIHRSNHS